MMLHNYPGVTTRFLTRDERLITSEASELPLVIEAQDFTDKRELQQFLQTHATHILTDIAHYGAVLLRGFDICSEEDFEETVLSIPQLKGISEAFMAEEGREHVGQLKYVLHTNTVYKTGGTLYLGGFHGENYYNPDVPTYICFFCQKPSTEGGETGLINMEKVYETLSNDLKSRLAAQNFFVSKWLVSEVCERYGVSGDIVERVCRSFKLPIVGTGKDRLILMYKPNLFTHPLTGKTAFQINLFELPTLNGELRKIFADSYAGSPWFWHRFVWRLPNWAFKIIENLAISIASFYHSPKNALSILGNKFKVWKVSHQPQKSGYDQTRVASCFNRQEVKGLAQSMRDYYSACLWQKGDILLIDNRKIAHAGMPGAGPRTIRAMICNPLNLDYQPGRDGVTECIPRSTETVGYYMATHTLPDSSNSSKHYKSDEIVV